MLNIDRVKGLATAPVNAAAHTGAGLKPWQMQRDGRTLKSK